jgi:hypothetical protein
MELDARGGGEQIAADVGHDMAALLLAVISAAFAKSPLPQAVRAAACPAEPAS